jgi:hypothetical protein
MALEGTTNKPSAPAATAGLSLSPGFGSALLPGVRQPRGAIPADHPRIDSMAASRGGQLSFPRFLEDFRSWSDSRPERGLRGSTAQVPPGHVVKTKRLLSSARSAGALEYALRSRDVRAGARASQRQGLPRASTPRSGAPRGWLTRASPPQQGQPGIPTTTRSRRTCGRPSRSNWSTAPPGAPATRLTRPSSAISTAGTTPAASRPASAACHPMSTRPPGTPGKINPFQLASRQTRLEPDNKPSEKPAEPQYSAALRACT